MTKHNVATGVTTALWMVFFTIHIMEPAHTPYWLGLLKLALAIGIVAGLFCMGKPSRW